MRNTRKSGHRLRSKKHPRPTPRSGRGSRINCNTSHQIPVQVIEAENACAASVPAPARFSNLQCPLFARMRTSCKSAKDRIVTAEEVIRNEPDIIIGSWCGKKFRPEKVAKRPGFNGIPAVKYGALHEIKSPLILQPGPAALTDGLAALQAIIANAFRGRQS